MKRYKLCLIAVLVTLTLSLDYAQCQTFSATGKRKAAVEPNLPVSGIGTVRQRTKWTGLTGSNHFLGDSAITEAKLGNIKISTTAPTSKLTIQGMIETTLGGLKFPDGTVQTATANMPLFTVTHDTTLIGNGTAASPLGVAVPLNLVGANPVAILNIENNFADPALGGLRAGVRAAGASSDNGFSGSGVVGVGGSNTSFDGGFGVEGSGGISNAGFGGVGMFGEGGFSFSGQGGIGVFALGGDSNSNGGHGVVAIGGHARGAGHKGGDSVFAAAGFGFDGATDGLAGLFNGDVLVVSSGSIGGDLLTVDGDARVTGNLSKASGSFKIDHPLDPENKYLYHSFVESPDMMNIYNGNLTTDQNGDASVTLPEWFEALNRDFRYQLTVIGTFAQAIVASEVKDNRFTIKTNAPGVKVSWQVTGIRKDAWANKHRIKVEVEKDEQERGYYLHPEAFNQPNEKSIEWARHPEQMQHEKQLREQARQKSRSNNQ